MKFDPANPHAVLGAHERDGVVVIRAYRPDAVAVRARGAFGAAELAETGEPGLFEGLVADADLPLSYELEISYPDGNTYTLRDPYAFLPTLGELDLHLAAEGRHERIYERLGAHVRELEGVPGTAFAVWAPNARGVSVVGDFNSW
ncbi:MAG: 1,4-alpha-glucan branching enzyme, partial [Actinomycetota bacterium]|nr:1,4-alpha-glucan branching enzyme [Actinomycetota bacterium]